jgi:hypothetical protein
MTGSESEWPMIFALGAPHRGQTIPEVDRFAMKSAPLISLDGVQGEKDARIVEFISTIADPKKPDQADQWLCWRPAKIAAKW